ncbi:MAG: hypothetical protein AAF721_15510 [Myxococcota bacterium]
MLPLLLLMLGGCKTEVPAGWEGFVPADDLTMAVETSAKDFGADKQLFLGYDPDRTETEIHTALTEKILAAGYTQIARCHNADGFPVSTEFIKAPASHVQIYFGARATAESGPIPQLFRTAALRSLRLPEGCAFDATAKSLCSTTDGRQCVLPRP